MIESPGFLYVTYRVKTSSLKKLYALMKFFARDSSQIRTRSVTFLCLILLQIIHGLFLRSTPSVDFLRLILFSGVDIALPSPSLSDDGRFSVAFFWACLIPVFM